jgi:hypothetical protein
VPPTPEIPRLPAPPPQLALPAPEAPPMPRIAAPPEIPQVTGPRPQLALPAPEPRLGGIPPAPGKQVQGAPIEQTPMSRGLARGATGAIAGGARGGIPGAVLGGLQGVAPEIIPYIMKNLHLR